jgi:hypothetical protein
MYNSTICVMENHSGLNGMGELVDVELGKLTNTALDMLLLGANYLQIVEKLDGSITDMLTDYELEDDRARLVLSFFDIKEDKHPEAVLAAHLLKVSFETALTLSKDYGGL